VVLVDVDSMQVMDCLAPSRSTRQLIRDQEARGLYVRLRDTEL
jgi:hypothetical protein